jgi:CheY-like chemotaxis protein
MIACPWCAASIDRGHCGSCERPLEPEWRVCPWCRTPAPTREESVAATLDGPPRLLLVEDDPSVRDYVTTVLSGAIEVDAVATASEALEKATAGGYDGIVVDHRLPDLTGVEMIRLLRSEARTAAVPVWLFTGDTNPMLEDEARNAGADDYLVKPVEPMLLEERCWALVGRSARIPG